MPVFAHSACQICIQFNLVQTDVNSSHQSDQKAKLNQIKENSPASSAAAALRAVLAQNVSVCFTAVFTSPWSFGRLLFVEVKNSCLRVLPTVLLWGNTGHSYIKMLVFVGWGLNLGEGSQAEWWAQIEYTKKTHPKNTHPRVFFKYMRVHLEWELV